MQKLIIQITKHAYTKQDILIQLAIGINITLQTLPRIWYGVKDGQIYTLQMLHTIITITVDSFIPHKSDQEGVFQGQN